MNKETDFPLEQFLKTIGSTCKKEKVDVHFFDSSDSGIDVDTVNNFSIHSVKYPSMPDAKQLKIELAARLGNNFFSVVANFSTNLNPAMNFYQQTEFVDISELSAEELSQIKVFANGFAKAVKNLTIEQIEAAVEEEPDLDVLHEELFEKIEKNKQKKSKKKSTMSI